MRQYVIELTQRTHDCCERIDEAVPLSYTARFLDRVLKLFRAAVVEDTLAQPEWVGGEAERMSDLVSF